MSLRWVFTVVIRLKNIFEFMFNRAPDQLYIDRASRSSREKDLKNIFSTTSPACLTTLAQSRNDIAQRVDGSEFDFSHNLFLFASFLIFFSSSSRLVLVLVIAGFFCFFIWLKIFRFINFFLYCLMLPIPPKSFARSCDLRICSMVYNVSHEDTNRITEM